MNKPTIHPPGFLQPPTEEENQAALNEFFAEMQKMKTERKAAVAEAIPALERLIDTFPQRTGQSYKLRDLLYSLWNGKPASLSDVLNLDWDLRKDLCAVILAFGYEDRDHEFFYDAIATPLKKRGQFEWFIAAHAVAGHAEAGDRATQLPPGSASPATTGKNL